MVYLPEMFIVKRKERKEVYSEGFLRTCDPLNLLDRALPLKYCVPTLLSIIFLSLGDNLDMTG